MLGLPMLDVIIGLVFVYLLMALICTTAMEMVVGLLDSRSANLLLGIQNLLGEHPDHRWIRKFKQTVQWANKLLPDRFDVPVKGNVHPVADEFFDHPLIKSLREDHTNPSYIPPATFAAVIVDMYAPADGNGAKDLTTFTQGVNKNLENNPDLRKILLLLAGQAGQAGQGEQVNDLKKRLEDWFNDGMARASARYKYKTQIPILCIATLFCFVINADTFRIASDLYQNPVKSAAVVKQIESTLPQLEQSLVSKKDAQVKELSQKLQANVAQLQQAGLSLGWKDSQDFQQNAVKGFFGIMLTALAATLGAPFWFDILKRFMSIRAVGKSLDEQTVAAAKTKP